jgi:hypothetical protein
MDNSATRTNPKQNLAKDPLAAEMLNQMERILRMDLHQLEKRLGDSLNYE